MTQLRENQTQSEQQSQEAGEPLFDRLLGLPAAVSCFFLMVVSFVDVVGRNVNNSPLPGGSELTELGMVVVIFCAMPLISKYEEHVAVDILDGFIPKYLKRFQAVGVNLVAAIVTAILSWRVWIKAEDQMEYGDVTEFLQIPFGPVSYFMSVMLLISAAVLLINAIKHAQGQKPAPVHDL